MIRINFLVINFLISILIFSYYFSIFSNELNEVIKIDKRNLLKELPPELLWKIIFLLDKKSKCEFSVVSKSILAFFPPGRKKVSLEKLGQFCEYVSKAPLKERLEKIKIYAYDEVNENKFQRIQELITIVENCPLIQELNIRCFEISKNNSDEEDIKLIEFIKKLKSIETLIVLKLNNTIFRRNYKNFNSFINLETLSICSIYNCYLSNLDFLNLCSNFIHFKKLKKLEIINSKFVKLENLKELKNSLKIFYLLYNFKISNDEFKFLEELENLEECLIKETNMSIFPNFSKLKKLKKLILCKNHALAFFLMVIFQLI